MAHENFKATVKEHGSWILPAEGTVVDVYHIFENNDNPLWGIRCDGKYYICFAYYFQCVPVAPKRELLIGSRSLYKVDKFEIGKAYRHINGGDTDFVYLGRSGGRCDDIENPVAFTGWAGFDAYTLELDRAKELIGEAV